MGIITTPHGETRVIGTHGMTGLNLGKLAEFLPDLPGKPPAADMQLLATLGLGGIGFNLDIPSNSGIPNNRNNDPTHSR